MYIVTLTRADGHVFNYEMEGSRVRHFLELAGSVLLPGETLTYRHA